MKKIIKSKAIMVLTVLAVVGFVGYALADWGVDCGTHGREHYDSGRHHHGRGGHGHDCMMGDLSEGEIKKMDEQHKVFFKETKTLRHEIYKKELALRSELEKKDPGAKVAASLQKEISDLDTQLDQKMIGHIIEMKKINPNVHRGIGHSWGYGCRGDCRR